jgi:hypothetical protein
LVKLGLRHFFILAFQACKGPPPPPPPPQQQQQIFIVFVYYHVVQDANGFARRNGFSPQNVLPPNLWAKNHILLGGMGWLLDF